jgi:hypothetical protein
MSAREQAEDLLVHYFRVVFGAAGQEWDSDNDAEIRGIVDGLLDAALLDAKAEVEVVRQEHRRDAGSEARWQALGGFLAAEIIRHEPAASMEDDESDEMAAAAAAGAQAACSAALARMRELEAGQ